jgi:hypothetical protein
MIDAPLTPRDAPDNEDSAVLQLDRELLLSQLGAIGAAASTDEARRAADELRAASLDPSSALRQPGGEPVVFPQAYLLGELDQMAAAFTLERARYYAGRLIRGATVERTSAINDINLNRWKEYGDIITDSLWQIERRDSSGAHSADYWGNFVPQIPNQLMRRYTKRGDWVIDAFAGSGTTLIEGRRLGRNVLGVELQPHVAERARQLLEAEPNPHDVVSAVVAADSANVDYAAELGRYGRRNAQLAILHPPYFDIIRFSEDARDLSNAPSVDAFLAMLGGVVASVAPFLQRGRHLALVIGDTYAKGDWIPLGFQAMSEVQRHGFALKSIVVKNFEGTLGKRAQKELWRYRALAGGFYVFKHEYVFLFRKP